MGEFEQKGDIQFRMELDKDVLNSVTNTQLYVDRVLSSWIKDPQRRNASHQLMDAFDMGRAVVAVDEHHASIPPRTIEYKQDPSNPDEVGVPAIIVGRDFGNTPENDGEALENKLRVLNEVLWDMFQQNEQTLGRENAAIVSVLPGGAHHGVKIFSEGRMKEWRNHQGAPLVFTSQERKVDYDWD